MTESNKKMVCDTCKKQVSHLRRDVVDEGYNALTKPALWNCEDCYQTKRRQREAQSQQQ
jgi:hypothetical protein